MTEMTVKKYIEEHNRFLPPELYDMVLDTTHIWDKGACYGYVLMVTDTLGYDREHVAEVMHHLHNAMADYTVDEALARWRKFF